MSQIEHYREAYEYEKDCNQKLLAMIESVPEASRGDARFHRAVSLAGHLAACRENWLSRMDGTAENEVAWFDESCDLSTLRPRFAALEGRWTEYLARLNENRLAQEFEFSENGETFRLPVEVQIVQLFGHADYHRGQIALLTDLLGGETVDTDYVDWWWTHRKEKQ